MLRLDELPALVAGVGEAIESVDSIVQTDEASWVIRFAEFDVAIEADAEAETFAFLGILGAVEETQRERVHAALLRYNMLQRETGGVSMALTAEGEAAQLALVRLALPTTALLATCIGNFADRMEVWRGFIRHQGPEEPPAPETFAMIRV